MANEIWITTGITLMNSGSLRSRFSPAFLKWLMPVLLLGFLFLVYGRTLGYGFYWDDNHLSRPWTWQQVAGVFAGRFDPLEIEPPYFRPLVSVSFALSWQLFGYEPWGYHLTNILLQGVVGWLVYWVARRIGFGRWAAWATALLFVVIPGNAATAVYIANRGDALLAIFGLLAVLSLDRYWRSKWAGWLVAMNGSLALALCCKEMALSLPALLIWYGLLVGWVSAAKTRPPEKPRRLLGQLAFWVGYAWERLELRDSWKRWLGVFGPPFLVVGFYLVYRAMILPKAEPYKEEGNIVYGYFSAVYQALKGGPYSPAPWLLGLVILPLGLAFFTQRESVKWRYFFFGLGWMLVACGPLALLLGNIEPRLLYLAMVGYAVAVVALFSMALDTLWSLRGSKIFWVGVGVVLVFGVVYGAVDYRLNRDAQESYAPYSENTLMHDEEVYNDPVLRVKYPAVNVRVMAEKLRETGRLK
jgi:hypothetical protein